MNFKTINNRIHEIQRADDDVKRRWLVVLSSISMVIILSLWFFFFSASIPAITTEKSKQVSENSIIATSTEAYQKDGEISSESGSFFRTLGLGAATTWSSFIEKVSLAKREVGERFDRLMEFAGQSREISITATSTQFRPE